LSHQQNAEVLFSASAGLGVLRRGGLPALGTGGQGSVSAGEQAGLNG